MNVNLSKATEIVEYYKPRLIGELMDPKDAGSRQITDVIIIPIKVDTTAFTRTYLNTGNNKLAIAASNLGGDEFDVKIIHYLNSDVYFLHGSLEDFIEKSEMEKIW